MFSKFKEQLVQNEENKQQIENNMMGEVHAIVKAQGFDPKEYVIGVAQEETEEGGAKGLAATMLTNSVLINSKDWIILLNRQLGELTLIGIANHIVDFTKKYTTEYEITTTSDVKNMLKDELTSMIGFGGKKTKFGGRRAEKDLHGRTTVKIIGAGGNIEILVGKESQQTFSAYYYDNNELFEWFSQNKKNKGIMDKLDNISL